MTNEDTLEQDAVKQVQAALNESKSLGVDPNKPAVAAQPSADGTPVAASAVTPSTSIDALLAEKQKKIDDSIAVMDKKLHEINMAGKSLAGQAEPQISKAEKTKTEISKLLKDTGLNPFAGEGAKAL